MRFSICIPNFNYEPYLGKTIESVLNSSCRDFEILVSDNASQDGSVALIEHYQRENANIQLRVNASNVGFAANLDLAGSLASGERMIMLSSDDIMKHNALERYAEIIQNCPNSVVCASMNTIDSTGNIIGYVGPNKSLWRDDDVHPQLSELMNCRVYKVNADILLKRCLVSMATPFNFCTTCYSRRWFLDVGGYGSARLINPDKWFHWKLLTRAPDAIFIDEPLFQYRWHSQNQTAIQMQSGYLKYLTDEYRNVMEITEVMLKSTRLTQNDIQSSFVQNDIYKHGIGEFLKGRWLKSLRIFLFGLACFPGPMISRPVFVLNLLVLLTTPIGSAIAGIFYKRLTTEG